MARANTKTATPRKGSGPVKSANTVSLNEEGFLGFTRDPKAELFLSAVTFLNEDNYYESAKDRQDRIANLTRKVCEDGDWILGLVRWLRFSAHLRSVPTIIAVEAVKARLDAGMHGQNRKIISSAIGRLDETGDVLAYWTSRYGRKIPSAVKRGVNDALQWTLNEQSALKWSGRMGNGSVDLRDVLNLTHPKLDSLGKYIIDSAYDNDLDLSDLPIIRARKEFLAQDKEKIIKDLTGPDCLDIITNARLTHEVIAGAIGVIPGAVWDTLAPTMGYTALRMNLRRIHEAGVSKDTIKGIKATIADKDEVTRSKNMPIEFLSAYRNAPPEFASALEKGANGVLENIPKLKGRTLILVDCSGSMSYPLSERSTLNRSDAANIFGAALHLNAENSEMYSFDNQVHHVDNVSRDLLRLANSMRGPGWYTWTRKAIEDTYDGHDRVILLTDEQAHYHGDVFKDVVPANVPCFTWDMSGYATGHSIDGPARITFGGLTDKGFEMIPLIENGKDFDWPWA